MFLNASDFICDKNTSTHSLIGRAIGINFSFSIVEIDGQTVVDAVRCHAGNE
jgi:hypothetical protein